MSTSAQGLRIILGGDDAGFSYKTALAADLAADPRVSSVTDAGPNSASDKTAYPHYAVAAARAVACAAQAQPPRPAHRHRDRRRPVRPDDAHPKRLSTGSGRPRGWAPARPRKGGTCITFMYITYIIFTNFSTYPSEKERNSQLINHYLEIARTNFESLRPKARNTR